MSDLDAQLRKNGRYSVNRMTVAEINKLLEASSIDPRDVMVAANGDLVLVFKI